MKKVSVVKCGNYDLKKVYDSVKKSLGLIDFKFKKNMKVLLKPNVLGSFSPDKHVTTHPVFLEA